MVAEVPAITFAFSAGESGSMVEGREAVSLLGQQKLSP